MLVEQRDFSWDFLKFILMFLIVFGHFCPAGEMWTPVTRIVGLCAIPGFFFVSGYFQSHITNCSHLLNKIRKTGMRIVVPMFAWGTIYVLLNLVQRVLTGEFSNSNDICQFLKYSPFYIAGIYWFFTALLYCIFIGSLLSWITEMNKMVGLLLTTLSPFCFCLISPFMMEHYHFSFIWFFYVVGMLYNYFYDTIKINIYISDLFFLLLFIVVILIGIHFEPQYTFYYTENLLRNATIRFIASRYLLYFAATISVIYGVMRFYNKYKQNPLVFTMTSYGIDTLFIYCFHMQLLVFIYKPLAMPYLYHKYGNWMTHLLEHIVGIIASIVLYWLMQKMCSIFKRFRWLRIFLMGTK